MIGFIDVDVCGSVEKKVSHKLMVFFFVKLSFYSTGFCVVRFE